jgi:hypothetical protein
MNDARFEKGASISDSDISEIEHILNRKLPEDYCKFVKKFGGAFVGGNLDGKAEFPIDAFLSNEHNQIIDTLKIYTDLKDDGIMPFAKCILGNIWAIDKNNNIYYINYYGGKTESKKVAENFTDFISRIVTAYV